MTDQRIFTAIFTEEEKLYLKAHFVGNEADTDQYREAWPESGFAYLERAYECARHQHGPLLNTQLDPQKELAALAVDWITAFRDEGGTRYAGASAAEPMLDLIFEILWNDNEHPYYGDDAKDIRERIDELKEDNHD